MDGRKAELLQRVESDREVQLDFFRSFICACRKVSSDRKRRAAGRTVMGFVYSMRGPEQQLLTRPSSCPRIHDRASRISGQSDPATWVRREGATISAGPAERALVVESKGDQPATAG